MSEPEKLEPVERRLPSVFYNPITLVGTWIAGVALLVILFLMVVEATSHQNSPYTGILTFVVLPAILVFGLLLVAFGANREHRRRQHGLEASERMPVVDLNRPSHLRAATWIGAGGIVFLMLTAFGSFKAYEYTETNEFCGTVCHTVMDPEYTAYQASAHARVHCVECHIGPGAEWFVKSKISGAYQVYSVLAKKYPKPIPTPVESLRPSSDTCERCHWPAQFYDEKLVTHDYYLSDDENTHMKLSLLMKIGGGSDVHGLPTEGIHWHMYINNKVEYYASDERRQEIPWTRVTYPDGTSRTYIDEEADFDPSEMDESEIRRLDCIDCHNRPSHNYRHPSREVNKAMARGEIDPALPAVKALSVEVLDAEYETRDEALEAIAASFGEQYAGHDGVVVDRAIEAVQKIYRLNYFPSMKVSWKEFPENIGHLTAPGCFRCHDGMHVSEEGETITRDCTVCHTILAQEFDADEVMVSMAGVEYQHPEDIGGAWMEMDCTECHAP